MRGFMLGVLLGVLGFGSLGAEVFERVYSAGPTSGGQREYTLGGITFQVLLNGSSSPKMAYGTLQVAYFEVDIKTNGFYNKQGVRFYPQELEEGLIKSVKVGNQLFQVSIEKVLGRQEVPDPKNKKRPILVAKAVTFKVIISPEE